MHLRPLAKGASTNFGVRPAEQRKVRISPTVSAGSDNELALTASPSACYTGRQVKRAIEAASLITAIRSVLRRPRRSLNMRILTVSDKVEPVLYGPYIRERVGHIDLILACGDLPYYYLEYIVSLLDRPLYYVHGNHDKAILRSADPRSLSGSADLGWAMNLHVHTARFQGLLLAGLEGCRVYNPGAPYQYAESEVKTQVLRLALRLLANRLRYGRYLDILITHAPPRGIHDGEDLPHRGFEGYLSLLRRFRPRLMVHGHQHVYNRNEPTETDYGDTRIINTFGYRVLELTPRRDGLGWDLMSSSR